MPTTTVRIQLDTAQTLRELSTSTGRSIQDVLAQAVDSYSRQLTLDQLNEDFARLRADPEAWREEVEERKLWEATLADDLTGDPDEE